MSKFINLTQAVDASRRFDVFVDAHSILCFEPANGASVAKTEITLLGTLRTVTSEPGQIVQRRLFVDETVDEIKRLLGTEVVTVR